MRAATSLFAIIAALSGTAFAQPEGCDRWALTGDIVPAPGATAQALVIDGDTVADVFQGPEARALGVESRCIVALPDGAVALPGLHDGHAHLLGIGLRELTLNLDSVRSVTELQAMVAMAAEDLEPGETLYGRGWIETGWPEGRMPMASDLDQVVPDNPVILTRADGHAAVVNTAALEAAGIDQDTPNPDGGRIVRDETGAATGILIDRAEDLVSSLLPQLDDERRREGLIKGAEVYASRGWTSVHNMSVSPKDVAIMEELAAAGDWPLRVFNYLVPEALPALAETGPVCGDDLMVCAMGVKFYVDGALGSRGALLFAPYSDDPSTTGLQLMSAGEAEAAFDTAMAAGLQVATHAIGDKGNRLVLDWYEAEGVTDARWRVEHAQIVNPADLARFGDAGIIASMQPSHAIGDLFFAVDRLGPDRLDGAYAWKSITDTGGVVVAGSDAPVEQGNPFIEIHAAVNRVSLDGYSDENWHREERLPQDEALAAFTTNAAYGVFEEDRLGALMPGYLADITVFAADPFTTPWDGNAPVMTVVGGKVVAEGK